MAGHRRFIVELIQLVIAPQRGGVIAVCVALAVVAKEPVKPLLGGVAGGPCVTQAPLAKGTGHITLLLQKLANGNFAIRNRVLTLGFHGLVVAHNCVARMLAGHQHAAGGRTHGVARIVGGKPHAFLGELVDIRRLDFLLAVGTEFRPSEVISHDEDNVWFLGGKQDRHKRQQ